MYVLAGAVAVTAHVLPPFCYVQTVLNVVGSQPEDCNCIVWLSAHKNMYTHEYTSQLRL